MIFFRFCFSVKFCNCAEFTRRINFWLGSAKKKSPICYPLPTFSILCSSVPRGAGWGERHPSILVVNCFQRVPFGITLCHPFLAEQPQNFSKASLAPIWKTLRGELAPKKRHFLVNIFQKMPKNAFFGLFFEKFACRKLLQNRVFIQFWESSQNQISRPKKNGRQNFQNCSTPPPKKDFCARPWFFVKVVKKMTNGHFDKFYSESVNHWTLIVVINIWMSESLNFFTQIFFNASII